MINTSLLEWMDPAEWSIECTDVRGTAYRLKSEVRWLVIYRSRSGAVQETWTNSVIFMLCLVTGTKPPLYGYTVDQDESAPLTDQPSEPGQMGQLALFEW